MQDCESKTPICHDIYARNFMDEEGLRILSSFAKERNQNLSNVARHRIIDDILRSELSNDPDIQIILVGAGFDSRAYRLNGGRWIELDEPQIVAFKNERLPIAECKNDLQRIPIDFDLETIGDKLQNFSSTRPVIVIFEGVFIYLQEELIRLTLQALRNLFPNHTLICDLMTDKFYRKYSSSLHQKISELGAEFKFTLQSPSKTFCGLGYNLSATYSIVGKAIEYGAIKIPHFIFKTFLKTLGRGYSIYVFRTVRISA